MSGQFNTGESKLKAQMSIVFEAQMSYRFTGKKRKRPVPQKKLKNKFKFKTCQFETNTSFQCFSSK